MDLKEYRDKWENWSKGKKVISIIVGCCVLTFILLTIVGMISPDYNDSNSDGSFDINIYNVSAESSKINITDQETESSSYAYFYEDGSYAEAAYSTYTEENIKIKLDMNNLTISDDSVIDHSYLFDSGNNVYNETGLTDDIEKLLDSDSVSTILNCYDEDGDFVESFDDFDVSMDDGILSLKYSDSSTSELHVKQGTIDDIDYAILEISGTIYNEDYDRNITFFITTDKMDVNFKN